MERNFLPCEFLEFSHTLGTLQTMPTAESDDRYAQVAKEAGFSLHAEVAVQVWERDKLERLCRYISRPALSEKRL